MGSVISDPRSWMEQVGPTVEHLVGKLIEDWLSFHVQMLEHGGAFPATKELDVVAVDTTAEQGHSAPGSGGASRQVVRANASFVKEGMGCKPCLAGNIRRTDSEGRGPRSQS